MSSGKRFPIKFTIKPGRLFPEKPAAEMTKKTADGSAVASAAAAETAVDNSSTIPVPVEAVVVVVTPPFTPVSNRKKKSGGDGKKGDGDIRGFLQAAAAPAKRGREEGDTSPRDQQVAKKTAQEGEEQLEDMEDDAVFDLEDKLEAMRKKIMEKAGLSSEQVSVVMEVLTEGIKDILQSHIREAASAATKDATKAATEAAREDANRYREADRCKRSIIMHNADRWVGNVNNGYGLAENITAQIHRCMAHTVLVLDAFTIGQWVENKPPSSVFVTFGSVAQKATFFKVLARTIQERKTGWEQLRGISCRDAFPREHIDESKRLAQKGFALRQNGKAAAFRVVARGPACIPVLEVRTEGGNGSRGRWEIFRTMERPQPVVPQPGTAAAAATPPTNNRRGRADTPRKTPGSDNIERLAQDDMDTYIEQF